MRWISSRQQVVGEINRRQLGETVEVLVEDLHRGSKVATAGAAARAPTSWSSSTTTADWRGRLAQVRITWAGPWSMIGEVITN